MRKRLSWLHISDIHFRNNSKLDHADAFKRLRDDIASRIAEGNSLDVIFVSGDLAHAGQPAEFAEVAGRLVQLCDQAGIPHDRVFFCPGNHDSDRARAPMLLQGCLRQCKTPSDFQAFMETDEYSALSTRQAAYRECIRSFRGDDAGLDTYNLHALSQFTLDGVSVLVSSINSSLLANGGSGDDGNLQVCARAVEHGIEGWPDHDISFTLIHHPFDWLAPFEADRVERIVLQSADVVLRGHLHKRKLVTSMYGGIVSAAGAVWETGAGDYEYSIGTLGFDTLTYRITTARFVQATDEWMATTVETALLRDPDNSITPAAVHGELRGLAFPAQVAAVLAGYSSELVVRRLGILNYYSAQRILAESTLGVASGAEAQYVISAGNLLTFYGGTRLQDVITSELGTLIEYDRMLQAACETDEDFASLVKSREATAERLVHSRAVGATSWGDEMLVRIVADGDVDRLMGTAHHDESSLLAKLKASLARGARDPFEAWLTIPGPQLDFDTLAVVAARLAHRKTADLAKVALLEAAQRFPSEARRLNGVARTIATELSDSSLYAAFQQAVGRL